VNAVIFLGIVLMWAVVLVPMWLRRHDETEETRSVDKFSTAMHTLSRRDNDDRAYAVVPRRNWLRDVHVSGASAADGLAAARAHLPAWRRLIPHRRTSRREMSVAQRRRRTLVGLLATTFVTLLLAVVVGGAVLWTFQILADLCLVGFIAHLRIQARQTAVRPVRRPRPAPRPEAAPGSQPEPEPMYRPAAAPAPAAAAYDDDFAPVAVQQSDRPAAVPFDQSAVAERMQYDVAAPAQFDVAAPAQVDTEPMVIDEATPVGADADIDIAVTEPAAGKQVGSREWEPVPVPRPTYTTKPAAPPRRRPAPTFEPVVERDVRADHELDPVDDLEEILDRRWAVND
jgi:hypothetical protein